MTTEYWWGPKELQAVKDRAAEQCVEMSGGRTSEVHAPYAVLNYPPQCTYRAEYENCHRACLCRCHSSPTTKRGGREPTQRELRDFDALPTLCRCFWFAGHYSLVEGK